MRAGIPFIQIDANLELDPRVQLMHRAAHDPSDYYRALGAYVSILLASANAGSRELGAASGRLYPPELLLALSSVDLLGEDMLLPEPDFEHYVGQVQAAKADRSARMRDLGRRGGATRAERAARDDSGRMVADRMSRDAIEPSESTDPDGDPRRLPGSSRRDADDMKTQRETTGSSLVVTRDAGGAAIEYPMTMSQAEWLAYVVEADAQCRMGPRGRPLSPESERKARLGDYWAAHMGRSIEEHEIGRLAGLVKEHPKGYSGLLADISATAIAHPKGDPLDYLISMVSRKDSTRAGRPHPRSTGVDYDGLVGAHDANA